MVTVYGYVYRPDAESVDRDNKGKYVTRFKRYRLNQISCVMFLMKSTVSKCDEQITCCEAARPKLDLSCFMMSTCRGLCAATAELAAIVDKLLCTGCELRLLTSLVVKESSVYYWHPG